MANILFVNFRSLPYLKAAISFLTTRVNQNNLYDYKKLSHYEQYVRATEEIPLVINVNKASRMSWWIDAAYGVHTEMKRNYRVMMFLGKRAMQSKLAKQNINIQSSTEDEIIGVDNHMYGILCSIQLLKAHRHKVEDNIIHQDNKNAMLMKKMGNIYVERI